jgi:hypothetical protein
MGVAPNHLFYIIGFSGFLHPFLGTPIFGQRTGQLLEDSRSQRFPFCKCWDLVSQANGLLIPLHKSKSLSKYL